MNTRSLQLGAPLLLSAFATLALAGPAQVDGPRIIAADCEPGNWMSHGRTYDEQRYSPLNSVNADNIGQLGMAWTTKLDVFIRVMGIDVLPHRGHISHDQAMEKARSQWELYRVQRANEVSAVEVEFEKVAKKLGGAAAKKGINK